MTAIATDEAFGRAGSSGKKDFTPPAIERDDCDGTMDVPADPAAYVDFWVLLSARLWGKTPTTRYSAIDGKPFIVIDDVGGIDGLLPFPTLGGNIPAWAPYLPLESGNKAVLTYYAECLRNGTDICPALDPPSCSGWGCCLTPPGAVDTLPRAYPSCLRAVVTRTSFGEPSNNRLEPLAYVKALSLLPRIMYREMAPLIRVVKADSLSKGELPGGMVYLAVAPGSKSRQSVDLQSDISLLQLTPELFERITFAVARSMPYILNSLSISNLRSGTIEPPVTEELSLACHDGKTSPSLLKTSGILTGTARSIAIGSGNDLSTYGPLGERHHTVAVRLTSFRGWTWLMPVINGSIDDNSNSMCRFISEIQSRDDLFANCDANGPQNAFLYVSRSALDDKNIRVTVANLIYIRAALTFIASNIPSPDFGLPCSTPVGIPSRHDSFPFAKNVDVLLGTVCGLPTQ
ncbi:hypothetical protein [Paraburkholderia strydomiana]|uniref:hypothetical protein n=1 Tax=Paraburkholderia strydomiana TaxID=1245417 RepID=UPI00285B35BC|nr:hypothetical protein [Paraburkholderia strydomiana]MDR7010068.1 hypothetical protein [Paraburkholderia strydomiana]